MGFREGCSPRQPLKRTTHMVFLSRITTKSGDGGETGLGNGQRVPKDHPRIAAVGAVDELNAVLGLLLAHRAEGIEADLVRDIQNDLFDLGADLCLPQAPEELPGQHLRLRAEQVLRLEAALNRLNEALGPLTSFVLPGGTTWAAWCHLARTVCRRVERDVVALLPRSGSIRRSSSTSIASPMCFLSWPARPISVGPARFSGGPAATRLRVCSQS